MVLVYLDACTINRVTDDRSQPRIHDEAEAVLEILRLISTGVVQWVATEILARELLRNPNPAKLDEALGWLRRAGTRTSLTRSTESRARTLAAVGYGYLDALHLASAEAAQVDALITTDDRFLRKAQRRVGNPAIHVVNPLDWLQEMYP